MLPVEFLPDVDELPVSWMNRLALANGFIDVNDMLRSYRIIDGKKVIRHLDYFPKVLGLISDNAWSKSILSIYKQDVKDQYDIIPYHNDEHLCVCPECMKEDMTRFGHIVYHFQHQYPGSFTCWKHKCILEYVQPDQRFIQDMNRMEFIPIKGSYDRDTEFKMFSTCYSKGSIFYKIVRYQLEVLMRDKHLTDNEVVEAFRCKGDEEELPMKVVQMIHTKSVDYFTFREQRVLLQLLFDDYPRYVSFFSKIDPVHMIGYRRRKVSNGMMLAYKQDQSKRENLHQWYNRKRMIYRRRKAKKMSNKKKQFDQEFKQNAVNYCLTHPELSRKECAKNLGIGDSTLYRWKQEAKANNNQATFKGSGNLTETELENRRLKRELKDTQDALEILKKAISILGE